MSYCLSTRIGISPLQRNEVSVHFGDTGSMPEGVVYDLVYDVQVSLSPGVGTVTRRLDVLGDLLLRNDFSRGILLIYRNFELQMQAKKN